MGDAADDGAEHESGDEGEEDEVDEAFQPVVAQPRHGLHVVLQAEKSQQQEMLLLRFTSEEPPVQCVHTHTHTRETLSPDLSLVFRRR